MPNTWRADAALVLNTVIWGVTFTVVKDALADASPVLFVAIRFSLAALLLLAIYHRKLTRRTLGPGLLIGAFLFAGYAFQTAGLKYTTPSKSAFLTALSIPLVPLISSFVHKTKPRFVELVGVLAATLGMALLTLDDFHFSLNFGDALTLCCAVAFAGHLVALGYGAGWAARRGLGFESIAVWQIASAACFGMATFRLLDVPVWHATPKLGLALAVTGILATALAFTVQAWAQRYTTATRTALIYSLEPVLAWATSWFLTGERLPARGMAGAALILAGILLVEMKREDVAGHPMR